MSPEFFAWTACSLLVLKEFGREYVALRVHLTNNWVLGVQIIVIVIVGQVLGKYIIEIGPLGYI